MNGTIDLKAILKSFHLPVFVREYQELARQAEREGWGYEDYLRALCDGEHRERGSRRTERILYSSGLPEGKTLETLNRSLLPLKVQRQLPHLLSGHFVRQNENLLVFGLPGRGKTHLVAAIGRELILNHGFRVFFITTYQLIQRLLIAKRDLLLEKVLRKLDGFDVVILDDIGYVQQNRDEMEVLFTFLADRYERRSLMITSNLVFSQWDRIFKDPMTTAAAIDRLVHHSQILELDSDSYRVHHAKSRQTPHEAKTHPSVSSLVSTESALGEAVDDTQPETHPEDLS